MPPPVVEGGELRTRQRSSSSTTGRNSSAVAGARLVAHNVLAGSGGSDDDNLGRLIVGHVRPRRPECRFRANRASRSSYVESILGQFLAAAGTRFRVGVVSCNLGDPIMGVER